MHFEECQYVVQDIQKEIAEIEQNEVLDYIAVMVLHANESRLSINEQGSGIGLGKMFKALQKNSNNHVLVAILHDTSTRYTEFGPLLSAPIFSKVASQFTDQQLNGEHGLVLSWDSTPTPAHINAVKTYITHFPKSGHCIISDVSTHALYLTPSPDSVEDYCPKQPKNGRVNWVAVVENGKIVRWESDSPLIGRDISDDDYAFLQRRFRNAGSNGQFKITIEHGTIKEIKGYVKCWIF